MTSFSNVKKMVEAIERAHEPHWGKELSRVYSNVDYLEVVLDTAFARLYESEMDACFVLLRSHLKRRNEC